MEKTYDVIVIGELNVDLIMNRIITFPQLGKEVLAEDMQIALGSSSAIFASNLSSLGAKVLFKGAAGCDTFGNFVIRELSDKGVDTSEIIQDEQLKTGATVAINFGNDRAMVTYPGAMEHYGADDADADLLCRAKHLHISSVFLQPALKKNLAELLRTARSCNLTTSLDTQWDPAEKWDLDLPSLLPYVDVFLPNEGELLRLTGRATVDDAILRLRDYSNTIAVKTGTKGSTVYHAGASRCLPAFLNPHVVDAIGAGDSFNAGFISKYIAGCPIDTCQEFGNLAGAVSTTAAGGTGAFTSLSAFQKTAETQFNYRENETETYTSEQS